MDHETLLQKFYLLEQELYLLPQKALYWKEKRIMVVSDLHLGKASHFRKAGIPIPVKIHEADHMRLELLIKTYDPEQIIFLGDLFHSHWNNEWHSFRDWCIQNSGIKLHLVEGNHDILPSSLYDACNLIVHREMLVIPPFIFSHEPLKNISSEEMLYNIAGHIHPGVKLSGTGRQSLVLPCFYFKKQQGILPAFGNFTGSTMIRNKEKDKVFIVTKERVILV